MVYKVIGLMSGSSLDGLDIVHTVLEEVRGQWKYEIVAAACIPYTEEWGHDLSNARNISVPEFLKLNAAYGRYIGEQVNQFIEKNDLQHQVHFIASHGHTVLHEPQEHTTCQIGDGAAIAAITGLPVISDLRALDVALGGQGAPIVPIGDKLLFNEHGYWLNIGGICNVTVVNEGSYHAFDICIANQVLNLLAAKEGKDMDTNGEMAREGNILPDVLTALNTAPYYRQAAPKSLSNEKARDIVLQAIPATAGYKTGDLLRTLVQHIADQVAASVSQYPFADGGTMLVTGGGAMNTFLVEKIQEALSPLNITLTIPDERTIMYKEALVMALIGTLRWREETTVMSSVTGAKRDSIGGALWMGDSYSGE